MPTTACTYCHESFGWSRADGEPQHDELGVYCSGSCAAMRALEVAEEAGDAERTLHAAAEVVNECGDALLRVVLRDGRELVGTLCDWRVSTGAHGRVVLVRATINDADDADHDVVPADVAEVEWVQA